MIISTKKHSFEAVSVVAKKITKNGKSFPALKIVFDKQILAEDLEALTSGSFYIDENKQEGYNTVSEVSVTIGKVTTAEQEVAELETELEKAIAEHKEYAETVATVLPLLDDKTAVRVKSLFEEWKPEKEYAVGVRVVSEGILYKVREGQAHTSQIGWEPKNTPALWVAIDEEHEGTFEDPIPAVAGMLYEKDKHYVYNDIVYLCIRPDTDEGTVLQFTPDQLVGQYFEVAE